MKTPRTRYMPVAVASLLLTAFTAFAGSPVVTSVLCIGAGAHTKIEITLGPSCHTASRVPPSSADCRAAELATCGPCRHIIITPAAERPRPEGQRSVNPPSLATTASDAMSATRHVLDRTEDPALGEALQLSRHRTIVLLI